MRLIDADALVIDYYDDYETKDDAYTYAYVSKAQIDSAPSIDIDRPQGEWIDIGGYEVCKNCHEVKMFPHWNYCPNCGAKMKGANDE